LEFHGDAFCVLAHPRSAGAGTALVMVVRVDVPTLRRHVKDINIIKELTLRYFVSY
jgi:hypothetical protein